VVFYHCHKVSNNHTYLLNHGREVLFLVKSRRLRKLVALKTRQGDDIFSQDVNNHSHKVMDQKNHQVLELLRLVSRGGTMGSTQLVGCVSLEDMQKCISKNQKQNNNNLDYICLGGIYNSFYLDNTDCLRLAKLSVESIHLQLNKTVNQGPRLLLQQLLWPSLLLYLSLCLRAKE